MVGVVVSDGRRNRLDRCGFAVRPGEVFGLVGGSGAGKSTALAVAAGVLQPSRGRVLLDGQDVTRSLHRVRAVAGLLSHELPGPYDLTVSEWLSLWTGLDGVRLSERRARTDAACERFRVVNRNTPVAQLSRGHRRRLALARLWARQPALYVLDQPGDGLDGEGLRCFTAAVRAVVAAGSTVILADAAPHLPASLCDRVGCIEKGAITAEVSRSEAEFGSRIAESQGWAV